MSMTIKLNVTCHNLNTISHSRRKAKAASLRPNRSSIYNPTNPLLSIVHAAPAMQSTPPRSTVKSSLIDPDGGALVDLVVPEADRAARAAEAKGLPRVPLTRIDLEWVHVVGEGWASPLRGFMRESEYLQSLHFNSLRLPGGGGSVVNMSLPIVLAVDDVTKDRIASAKDVALEGPTGGLVAILRG